MGLKLITGKTGTAHVASADDRARIAATFGPGEYVVDSGNGCFAATIVDNNNISIGAGDLIAFGTHARIAYGDTEAVTIDSGAVGYNRIDLIVAEYKNTSGVESGTVKVIKGTPTTGTPVTPSVTAGNILQGASTNQTILYKVTLNGINIVTCERMFTVVSLPLASIAAAYSSSSTYAAGAIVSYGGKLYKCTTAISTPEAWTVGHWTLAVLADLLSAHTHTPASIGAAPSTHATNHSTSGSDPIPVTDIGGVSFSLQTLNDTQKAQARANIESERSRIQFINTAVAKTAFISDATYADYPYRASVALSGVLSTMVPHVVYGAVDAKSGKYAPVSECYNGGVYLYASAVPAADITVPTIICWR